MIPKIIHYCWLSGEPFPKLIDDCIKTWKEKMPEYEFVLWDTKRFDIHSNLYVKQAFEAKKYAFASDYIRLYALYHYGGIYLDSDIQVFKRFDDLLDRKAFTGFESETAIAAWILASEKGNPLFKELLDYYDGKKFIFPDGTLNLNPNGQPVTETFIRHGLKLNGEYQELDMITVFPRTYFCPLIPYGNYEECYSENTYAQHMFNTAWMTLKQKNMFYKKYQIASKYGEKAALLYYGIMTLKEYGVCSFFQQWGIRIKKKRYRDKDEHQYEENCD